MLVYWTYGQDVSAITHMTYMYMYRYIQTHVYIYIYIYARVCTYHTMGKRLPDSQASIPSRVPMKSTRPSAAKAVALAARPGCDALLLDLAKRKAQTQEGVNMKILHERICWVMQNLYHQKYGSKVRPAPRGAPRCPQHLQRSRPSAPGGY